MSINVSAVQLRDADLVDDVRDAIDEVGIDPRRVVLELTETMLISDSTAVVEVLERLRAVGVRLAIDDFGTGYASMSYLRRLPVDILKVDKIFVDGAGTETGAGTRLLRAILNLGHTLGLRTVAEGIEDADQLAALRAAGCDIGQGYYFSRPVTADDAWDLLDRRNNELVGDRR
jgi:EAL domain-containing protein (putative c-di-GMP-specific phosphodiesterase class I)